ncbi:11026_t:CDS:1, partial [Entrophospora sp. SA101]
AESQRFRVELRKNQFFIRSHFRNLKDDVILSERMKNFSHLAKEKRNILLKEILLQGASTNTWHSIPITEQEETAQQDEKNMNKKELLSIINSILLSLPETL